jgi:transcriptional regulator of arginine metabolism
MQRMTTREALEHVLTNETLATHAAIQTALAKHGHTLTQASISRALTRVGATKTHQPDGRIVYRLHKGTVVYRGQSPKVTRQAIANHMAERILWNGNLFVILGKPDSGRYLGTYVDDAALPSVAGTLAGGNTLLVLPMNAQRPEPTKADLALLFPETQRNF